MRSAHFATALLFTLPAFNPAFSDDQNLPELLIGLLDKNVQQLTPQEAADTRGESMRKKDVEYGHCGLRRCTKTFVNDKHLYTVYDDGSVYFVKH